jgi:hypothetical protein
VGHLLFGPGLAQAGQPAINLSFYSSAAETGAWISTALFVDVPKLCDGQLVFWGGMYANCYVGQLVGCHVLQLFH